MITLTSNTFNSNGYWPVPISYAGIPGPELVTLFDQNGYDLTELEKLYAKVNGTPSLEHRNQSHHALKRPWFTQEEKSVGAVLNHSLIFERKGYIGPALDQIEEWAKVNPLLYKVSRMRPKWGLDFSMDYADHNGNVFEILHWEWDGFDYEQVQVRKLQAQAKFATIDWDDAGLQILAHKDQWHHLDFFAQSDWKCNFFGITKEQFKMVIWQ